MLPSHIDEVNMNNFQRIAVIALLSLLLLACSGGEEAGGSTSAAHTPVVGGLKEFPPMGVKDMETYLADNGGKATIVMVWTTWCPSCKQELPEMEQLNKSHGDKVNIISVSLDEKVGALQKFFADKALDLPVYHGDQAFGRKFSIESIPTMLIFDKTGQLIFSEAGIFPHSMLSAMADKLAAE